MCFESKASVPVRRVARCLWAIPMKACVFISGQYKTGLTDASKAMRVYGHTHPKLARNGLTDKRYAQVNSHTRTHIST